MSVQKVVDLIQTMNAEQAALKAKWRAEVIDKLQAYLDEIPGLDGVEITGFTPSWNDGDECTHTQYVQVGLDSFGGGGFDDVELSEAHANLEDYPQTEELTLTDAEQSTLERALDAIDFEGLIGTNFRLIYIRTVDGSYFTQIAYDPGY
jgi:hypothetical protein